MKQKGLKEQNNLNKILSNEIKPVQNILNSIKGI